MPSSDSGESRRSTKAQSRAGAAPPQEQENLPCPRCDSTNTKFCYYNNYNYSQPRHFCKACRRYWTHGGTLRDIPVGGGSRKNAKRSRTHHVAAVTSSSAVTSAPEHLFPAMAPVAATQGGAVHYGGGADGDVRQNANVCGGSFTSLLNTTQGPPGFLALGGFGLGLGHGLEDMGMGFGIGRTGWAFPGMVDGSNIGGHVAASGVGNTWQIEGGDGGFVGGDCFPWPGLAISTPGNGLK